MAEKPVESLSQNDNAEEFLKVSHSVVDEETAEIVSPQKSKSNKKNVTRRLRKLAAKADVVNRLFSARENVDALKVSADIARSLKAADLGQFDVAVEFSHGVARLSGGVSDAKQRLQVVRIVSRVPGVREIDNRLIVSSSVQPAKPSRSSAIKSFSRVRSDAEPRSRTQFATNGSYARTNNSGVSPTRSDRDDNLRLKRLAAIIDAERKISLPIASSTMTTKNGDLARHYEVLRLPNDASAAEITEAYQHEARLLHTERFSDDPHHRQAVQRRLERLDASFQALTAVAP